MLHDILIEDDYRWNFYERGMNGFDESRKRSYARKQLMIARGSIRSIMLKDFQKELLAMWLTDRIKF